MTDRHAPLPVSYDVGVAGETLIYEPARAPQDIAATVFNAGDVVLKLRVNGPSSPYLPLAPGIGLTVNTGLDIYAAVDSGTGTAIVVLGVTTFASGLSTTGDVLSVAEVQAIAASRSQKQLLTEILLQAKLGNEYLKLLTDTELKLGDYNWSTPS